MRAISAALSCLVVMVWSVGMPALGQEPTISLNSLLLELVDGDAIARWPEPGYTCKQFSSYDRRRTAPDKPDWFANSDATQYIRVEQNAGRQEHVMMDADGPGAIVRFWLTTQVKTGRLRIYLDGAETPALVFPAYDLMQGDLKVGSPLLQPHTSYRADGGGGNTLYLPLPYAKHCKVTWEEQHPGSPRYYQINYRTYPAGTAVDTFSRAALDAARPTIERVGQMLLEPANFDGGASRRIEETLEPGGQASAELPAGAAAIRQMEIRVTPAREEDLAQTLRSTVLQLEFDGQRTVWCPLGDFSGSGVGGRPIASWYRRVGPLGEITCRWVMPYEKTARVTLWNLGKQKVGVSLAAKTDAWKWEDRSMHFHTTWRQQVRIPTRMPQDWNFLTVKGQGVLVGDTLAVYNPLATWYGEGNEKIWVDAESFPSHLGTGTEDYYNASWAPVVVYHTPFANAPRADTASSLGHNTFTRTRNLDGIPFADKLRFDMEIIPWAPGEVDFAATTYWYGRPGASATVGPLPEEAVRPLVFLPGVKKIQHALECEKMQITARSPQLVTEQQNESTCGLSGAWSDGNILLARGQKAGDFVELRFPAPDKSARRLILHAAHSFDYGILRCAVNGKVVEKTLDTYDDKVAASLPIDLGVFEPQDGHYTLRVEVVGAHPAAKATKSYFGLDGVEFSTP